MRSNMMYVIDYVLQGPRLRQFSLDAKTIARTCRKVFELESHQRFTTVNLAGMLKDLLLGESAFTLQHLRRSARNFIGTELDKELKVYHHLQPWINEVAQVHQRLGLSQMNQHFYAERADN